MQGKKSFGYTGTSLSLDLSLKKVTVLDAPVPDVLKSNDAVIVYGHGVFTVGKEDFNKPYTRMKELEASCMKEYARRARAFS